MKFLNSHRAYFRRFGGILSTVAGIAALAGACSIQEPTLVANTVARQPSPPVLDVPKVYTGPDFFAKREIFRYEKTKKEKELAGLTPAPLPGENPGNRGPDDFELNEIKQIHAGELDDEKGTDILAAGERQAFVLDPAGKVKKVIDYDLGGSRSARKRDDYLVNVKIADIDDDGKVEILGYGNIAAIFDLTGKIVWKYTVPKDVAGPDSMAIGDVDGNGRNEILIGIENRVEIFDLKGAKLQTFNYSEDADERLLDGLTIADFDADGKNEILAHKSVFEADGRKVKNFDRPFSWQAVFQDLKGRPQFLEFRSSKLYHYDAGHDVNRPPDGIYDAPLSSLEKQGRNGGEYSLFRAAARWARLSANDPDYLVVLAEVNDGGDFGSFKMLYVYDGKKRLIFHETIRARNSRISVLPDADGTESLLITDDGKVNIYKRK